MDDGPIWKCVRRFWRIHKPLLGLLYLIMAAYMEYENCIMLEVSSLQNDAELNSTDAMGVLPW